MREAAKAERAVANRAEAARAANGARPAAQRTPENEKLAAALRTLAAHLETTDSAPAALAAHLVARAAPKAVARGAIAKKRAARKRAAPRLPTPSPAPQARPRTLASGRTSKPADRLDDDAAFRHSVARTFRSKPAAPRAPLADDEMHVPAFAFVGARVVARGNFAGGVAAFEAEVVAHRANYPPIVVKYVKDARGATHDLALPTPRVAHVHAGMVDPM